MPYGTNYGVLLPACDGDVSTLQGARFFENAKYPTITTPTAVDNFAKVQWYVQGTNHNFFNTVWTQDDASTTTDPACSRQQPATTARLTPADQRRVGGALMNSFFRRYVGKETGFDPIMTGEVTLPASAAPLTSGKGLDQEVKTSYVAPAAQRFDVLRPNPIPDPQPDPATGATPTPFDATLTTTTASGGPISASGLTSFLVCNPNDLAWRQGPTFPTAYPLCPRAPRTAPRATSSRSRGTRPAATCAPSWAVRAPPSTSPSVGVLDLGLPDVDGVDVCREIRAAGDVPVIVVSARGEVDDRIQSLHCGADDYLVKPFDTGELLARMHAVLRRRAPALAPGDPGEVVTVAGTWAGGPEPARRSRSRATPWRSRARSSRSWPWWPPRAARCCTRGRIVGRGVGPRLAGGEPDVGRARGDAAHEARPPGAGDHGARGRLPAGWAPTRAPRPRSRRARTAAGDRPGRSSASFAVGLGGLLALHHGAGRAGELLHAAVSPTPSTFASLVLSGRSPRPRAPTSTPCWTATGAGLRRVGARRSTADGTPFAPSNPLDPLDAAGRERLDAALAGRRSQSADAADAVGRAAAGDRRAGAGRRGGARRRRHGVADRGAARGASWETWALIAAAVLAGARAGRARLPARSCAGSCTRYAGSTRAPAGSRRPFSQGARPSPWPTTAALLSCAGSPCRSPHGRDRDGRRWPRSGRSWPTRATSCATR